MSLRIRLWVGVTLLSVVAVAVAALGTYLLFNLANTSRAVLDENFRSLEYIAQMEAALIDLEAADSLLPNALRELETALVAQEANITEPGEADATRTLRRAVVLLKASPAASRADAIVGVRAALHPIGAINQEALRVKNARADRTAEEAIRWMVIACLAVGLLVMGTAVSLPRAVLGPIRLFTLKIQSISEGEYAQEVRHERADEFGTLAQAFNRMSNQLVAFQHSSLAELQAERTRLETLVASLSEGLVVLDADKRLQLINPAAARLLQPLPEGWAGKPASEVATANDLLRELLRPLLQGAAHPSQPLTVVAEGESQTISPESIVITRTDPRDGLTEVLGYAIVLTDVTRFRQLDEAKTHFLATVGHELKTPLASVGLSLKLLEDPMVGPLNPEQANLVATLRGENDRLVRLVSELLDMTQLETGRIQLRPSRCELPPLATAAVEALKRQAEEKKLKVVCDWAEDLLPVWADPDKTVWILTNLLGNAIRYSPSGGVILVKAAAEGTKLVLRVQDQGPGVPEHYRDKLFERYFQVPGGASKGMGLGLAISREFVEAMGGTLTYQAGTPRGAEFVVRLPLAL